MLVLAKLRLSSFTRKRNAVSVKINIYIYIYIYMPSCHSAEMLVLIKTNPI